MEISEMENYIGIRYLTRAAPQPLKTERKVVRILQSKKRKL